MIKNLNILKTKNVIYTGILLLFLTISTSLAATSINTREKQYFFDILLQTSQSLSMDITSQVYTNQIQLEVIAQLIAECDSLESSEVKSILQTYEARNIMSHIEILLPDNRVILQDGSIVDAEGILSFEEEHAQGIHISDVQMDLVNPEEKILRNFVPINKDGETIAMLYGATFLSSLPEVWTADAFDGNCYVYVIDGNKGDIIVDTWHHTPGSIWQMGEFKLKKGYTEAQLIQNISKGNSGHVVFESQDTGKELYFYYEPLPINNWFVCISVSEDIVFQNVSIVKNILVPFITFEVICFVCYVILLLQNAKKETFEKEKRLDAIRYIHDVEKYLFTAHLATENVSQALQRIAQMSSAENAFFISIEKEGNTTYTWTIDTSKQAAYQSFLESNHLLSNYFSHGYEHLLLYDAIKLRNFIAKYTAAKQTCNFQNIMAVPIKDMDNNLIGILGVTDMEHHWESVTLLDSVTLCFSMFCNNMKTYSTIKELGESDLLTGLLNRNSYEEHLAQYKNCFQESISCIYIDVNGLHELNNSKGHEAGDRMLQCVGHAVQDKFGNANTFRIGGDEFVAFAIDETETTVTEKVAEIKELMLAQDYHASFGISHSKSINSIEEFIRTAEKKMYEEKRIYYQENPGERHERH